MRPYARDELLRSRQIIADALVAAWVVAWIVVGRTVHALVTELARAGRFLEDAGGDFSRSASGGGAGVDDLPVVGDRLRAPFDAVAGAGTAVADAGVAQQEAVATLATVLGVVVALVPIVLVLARYLPPRLAWMRQAAAAEHLLAGSGGDLRLFALRALAARPLPQLLAVSADPSGDFDRDDPDVVRALADLELRSLGIASPVDRAPIPGPHAT